MYLYSTITELLLIVFLICVIYRFVRALHEFEDAVDNIILPEVDGCVQPLDRATEKIQTEFILSRRHERPLSVVLIEPELESFRLSCGRLMKEIQKTIMTRYATVRLARVIKSSLRRTDILLHDRGRFIVLCPETSDGASIVVADRIRAAVAEQFDVPVAYGTAAFPDKAFTFDELVKHAELHLQHSKEPSRASIYSFARTEKHKPSIS